MNPRTADARRRDIVLGCMIIFCVGLLTGSCMTACINDDPETRLALKKEQNRAYVERMKITAETSAGKSERAQIIEKCMELESAKGQRGCPSECLKNADLNELGDSEKDSE